MMNTNKTVGTQDEYKQNSGYTRHVMNTNKAKEKQHRKLKR
jgi:hypothetical protein